MNIEPGTTTTYDELMIIRIKCFASKDRVFEKSHLITMAAKISAKWKSSQDRITQEDMSNNGKQIRFTLRVLAGREYKFLPDVMDCTELDGSSCQDKSLVLHFR